MSDLKKSFHKPEGRRLSAMTGMLVVTGLTVAGVVGVAHAQITTDTSALGALGGAAPEKPESEAAPARKPVHRQAGPARKTAQTPGTTKPETQSSPSATATAGTPPSAAKPTKPPPAATIPAAPPSPPVLTPVVIPVELHPFPMPPDPQPSKDAKGEVMPISGGLRVTFGADSAQLNPETKNGILAFANMLKEHPDVRALVDVTASGVPNDLSRPRRMSLSRGLTVRAVLMNAGIPSTRIYVRVIGLPDRTGIETPADRADIRRSDEAPAEK
ncbi:hypothetical protein [Acetobacter sp.]|jgi:outer membrane protein OmpA-like peptidoglycan-associated protein|uniref:hypothetical protein n=1 Tax=Acetobacter sp. TaxID=440 RepID=UPI0025C50943|nr:hypothetical protein [Acetobacter sp.]MCH4091807.1 hypothetical protein [Acetobacter sp.]MCI1300337.1 hypothetical protein [Acetobacter sp.]MCI1316845.1 hypothetical protein [Acetobacter sp.]